MTICAAKGSDAKIDHMDMNEWFKQTTEPDTQRMVARKIGAQQSKISRQLKLDRMEAELVIDIARAYEKNIVQALVDTGFLHIDEVERVGIEEALDLATNRQFLAAIERRTDPDAHRLMGIQPGVINPEFGYDDLAIHRRSTPATPPSVKPLSDDELAAAIEEANQFRGAAQNRTEELTEPESP